MNEWLNVGALFKVLVFGLLAGAGVPALFAVGIRAQVAGAGDPATGQTATEARPLLSAVAYVCFGLVAVAVALGVMFVARDFIGHHTGWYIMGAVAK